MRLRRGPAGPSRGGVADGEVLRRHQVPAARRARSRNWFGWDRTLVMGLAPRVKAGWARRRCRARSRTWRPEWPTIAHRCTLAQVHCAFVSNRVGMLRSAQSSAVRCCPERRRQTHRRVRAWLYPPGPTGRRSSGESTSTDGPGHERLRPDLLQHLLEVPHVGGHDAQHRVRLAGDRCSPRPPREPCCGRLSGAARSGSRARHLHRPAQRLRVQPHGEPGDGAGRAQPVHPALDRRRAQPDLRAQLGEAAPGVLHEQREDVLVEPIELHRPIPADPGDDGPP